MNFSETLKELSQLTHLVERWQEQGYVPSIERDIARGRVQKLYELFLTVHTESDVQQQEPVEQEGPVVESEQTESKSEIIIEPEESLAEGESRLFGQTVQEEDVEDFVRELFWRDDAFYRNEISKLDAFENFDDILIYIGEKYSWAPDNKVAERFIELLEKKLS